MLENDTAPESESQPKPEIQLYSKTVIVAFCCLFSTLFGAILLHQNIKAIDSKSNKINVLLFGISYTFFSAFVINYFGQRNLGIVFNIAGAAILNEFFWNQYIGKETPYTSKSWTKPAIISLLIIIPLVWIMLTSGAVPKL